MPAHAVSDCGRNVWFGGYSREHHLEEDHRNLTTVVRSALLG